MGASELYERPVEHIRRKDKFFFFFFCLGVYFYVGSTVFSKGKTSEVRKLTKTSQIGKWGSGEGGGLI